MNAREFPSRAGVVIVGGGVMGASLAYHLALRGQRDVVLLEQNEVFGQGATGRCSVRHQFGSEINNVFVMAGFSGHGFMHGPIAGKLLAEIMLDGAAQTLDVSALDPNRFAGESATEREYNVV